MDIILSNEVTTWNLKITLEGIYVIDIHEGLKVKKCAAQEAKAFLSNVCIKRFNKSASFFQTAELAMVKNVFP